MLALPHGCDVRVRFVCTKRFVQTVGCALGDVPHNNIYEKKKKRVYNTTHNWTERLHAGAKRAASCRTLHNLRSN